MKTRTKFLFLCMGITYVFCSSSLAAIESNIQTIKKDEIRKDIRAAVIDVGSKVTPNSFSQFLWIHLAETPNIVLVEREQIERILKEQTLNLQFSDVSDANHIMRAGEILGADVLLMIESGSPAQEQIPVRLRLVETRYGMKFWDNALLLDRDENNHSSQAKDITDLIIARLKDKSLYSDFTFVGIGAFRSEELSQSWNWIADELAAGVEQNLVMQPAIVLLERRRTRPLMDERNLVENLPESLRSSVVFIDGSFRLDRQNNNKNIFVSLYGYSQKKQVFVINIEGSSNDLRQLSEKAVAAITDKLNIKHEKTPIEPVREANLLIEQAKSFRAFDDNARAVALYEAALAINPYSVDSVLGLLQLASSLSASYRISNRIEENRELYKREIIPLMLNNIVRVRHFVDNYKVIKAQAKLDARPEWMLREVMLQTRYVYHYQPVIFRMLGNHEDTLEILRIFQNHLSELYPVFLDMVKEENDDFVYSQTIQIFISTGKWWALSPQQYLDNVYDWLELSISKGQNNWSPNLNIYSYYFGDCPLWTDKTDNSELYLAFLNKLSQHSNPLIKACAHQAFVQYYADFDNQITNAHYKAFIDTIVNEIIPAFPEWGNAMGIWNPNLHHCAEKAVGLKCVAESQARIIHQIIRFSKRFPMGHWRDRILFCYQDLERTGQSQQAASLLTSCRDKLQKEYPNDKDDIETINSWLRVLKEKHPDLAIDIELIPTQECNPLTLIDSKDISYIFKKHNLPQSDDCFRRLLIDENSAAIVCVWDFPEQTRCGIIWLNNETFTFRAFQIYESSINFSLGNLANLHSFYYRSGPVSAIDDDTVYVSFPNFGVIIFPEKGKPKLLCQENGLPSNMLSSMDVMNGRLYATTGFLRSTGLIEVKLDTFQTKILISPRKRRNPHPLDGSHIVNVIADRWANRLWLSVDLNDRRHIEAVYYFDPETDISTPLPKETIIPAFLIRLQRQGHFLYISTVSNLYTVNLLNKEITLTANHDILDTSIKIPTFWQTELFLQKFAGNRKYLISNARDEGGENYTVVFNAGESRPRRLTGESFPPFSSIREFGCIEKGLFILTNQSLILIPNRDKN